MHVIIIIDNLLFGDKKQKLKIIKHNNKTNNGQGKKKHVYLFYLWCEMED